MYNFMQIVNVLYGVELYYAQVKMKLVSSLCYVFLINAKLCSQVKMCCILSFHVFIDHIADVG